MAFEMSNGTDCLRAQTNELTTDAVRQVKPRLSKRRRLQLIAAGQGIVALAALFALATGTITGVRAVTAHRKDAAAMTPAVSLTVATGETLWSMAREFGDPRDSQLDRVDALARANGLTASTTLHPGQKLVVPVESAEQAERLQVALAMR